MDKRKSLTVYGMLGAIVALALVVSTLAGGTALAGKGGNGKGQGNGNGQRVAATLSVSPNPAAAGTVVTITGSGLAPSTMHLVGVLGYAPWEQITTDASGGFSFTYSRTAESLVFPPGVYYVEAKEDTARGMVTVASATLTVVP